MFCNTEIFVLTQVSPVLRIFQVTVLQGAFCPKRREIQPTLGDSDPLSRTASHSPGTAISMRQPGTRAITRPGSPEFDTNRPLPG